MLVASSSSSSILIIYVVVFGALYFFYLRPRSRKQKAQRSESRKVEVGQRAQTESDLITLRTDAGVELDFVPTAIARRYNPVVPESSDDEHPTEGDAK